MRPCVKCKTNKWKYNFKDEERLVIATCINCNAIVKFKAKPRKPLDPNKIEACAEYEIKKGKRYLKINGEFKEVDLFKVNGKGKKDEQGKYLRVMPV